MAHIEAVDVSQKDCIRGEGKPNAQGYLYKNRGGRKQLQHRLAYLDTFGELPVGKQIHHQCDNKLCVNPNHLEALTKAEHQNRHTRQKLDDYYKAMTHCKYGHALDGRSSFTRGGRKKPQRYCLTCHRERSAIYHSRKRELANVTH